jgi:Holliday junction resolvase-like predicted endonuclease
MQEGQARKQIVHQGLGTVGVIGVAARACAKAGKVDGIAQVDALIWFVAVEEGEEGFAGLGVNVGTV